MWKIPLAAILASAGFASTAQAIQSGHWVRVHRKGAHVADCRVFDYAPTPLMVVNGPPDGEWFSIGAITCRRSAWPNIGLTVCDQRMRNDGSWRTLGCRAARRPDVAPRDYLTADCSFTARPFQRYRAKLEVRVRAAVGTFYGPEASL